MTEYERWLSVELDDKDLTEELLSIQDKPEEINDRFYRNLEFGTGGLRGVIGAGTNRMNVYTVRKATQGLANYLIKTGKGKELSVAIAHDSRNKGVLFAKESAAVLAANGIKAYLYPQLMPTPALSYAVRHLKCDAGICVTASHNPAKYNGYKAYGSDGCQVTEGMADGIMAAIEALDIFADVKKIPFEEALAAGKIEYIGEETVSAFIEDVYKESILGKPADNLKIVYTPLNGSGKMCVLRILDKIGVKDVTVVPEQSEPDGNFPTCPYPNPEIREALQKGLELCETVKPDLLLATDPDCDRVGIACMTESGPRLLNGNQIGCILLHYILSQKKERGELPANAAAVTTIVSTDMAAAIAKSFGCEMIEVLTGFKYIAEQIHRFETTGCNTFMFGFEESFGYLSGTDVRDKDGVNACMLIAEAAAWYKKMYNKTLVDAIDMLYEQYGYYGDKVTSFVLPGKDGLEKMQAVMQALRANPPKSFAGTDVKALRDYQTSKRICGEAVEALTLPKSNVLYFELEGGAWICVRPSGTEPKIKLYVNAVSGSAGETQRLLNAYSDAAVKLLESL